MFTGIIQAVGEVAAMQPSGGDLRLRIRTGKLPLEDVALVGPPDKIREELPRWRKSCITEFLLSGPAMALPVFADTVLG